MEAATRGESRPPLWRELTEIPILPQLPESSLLTPYSSNTKC